VPIYDAASASRAAAGASESHATIVAPLTGVVARRHAELGDMATPGKPLFTIYEPGGLRVTASIPQYRLNDMRNVKTRASSFPNSANGSMATAVTVLPTADAATHVSQVARQPAAGAGSHARHVRARPFRASVRPSKLTVPAAAVVRRGEVAAVYVMGADHRPACVSCASAKPSASARSKYWPAWPPATRW
jgi:multidrug efflux pump subunit AcrA (membrane-fusion protein)